MLEKLAGLYRSLPWFKGKLRLGKILFSKLKNSRESFELKAHGNVKYKIPNTIENLGLELLINGIYEQDVVKFLKRQVKDDDVFFDIGANIGAIGLPVVKDKPGVKYTGFEASPQTFQYLTYNFEKNKIAVYQLNNRLVHQNDDVAMKFYQSEFYGKSSLAATYTKDYILVNSISLDNYCREKNIHSIDWMKIDVQGFELNVFAGMRELLINKKIKNILFEFERWAELEAGFEAGAAQELLQSFGYVLYNIQGEKLVGVASVNSNMIWARP